jgi:DNA-binding CsgD family transcriptional regulator
MAITAGLEREPSSAAVVSCADDLLDTAASLLKTSVRPRRFDPFDSAQLVSTIDATVLQLLRAARRRPARQVRLAALFENATALQRVRLVVASRADGRALPLDGVGAALAGLRDITSSDEFYGRAAEKLCTTCGFDRSAVESIEGSALKPKRIHFVGDDEWSERFTEFLEQRPIPVADRGVEAEAAALGRPMVVPNAQRHHRVFRPMVEFAQTRSYVIAPVLFFDRVVGMLHVDNFFTGREADDTDRDKLWAFAEGFGLALQQFLLRQRVEHHTAQLERLADLTDLGGSYAGVERPGAEPVATTGASHGHRRSEAELRELEQSLTRREREVLGQLAHGATNATIADRLVITPETVKSHVRSILRKLEVANRAEAAALYLSLVARGRQSPG